MPPTLPRPETLDKYGLDAESFWQLWKDQGEACGVCLSDAHERYVIDHEHVRGWAKMLPEQRKLYVRGLIGIAENHYILTRYANAARLKLASEYLARFEARRP